MLDGMPVDLAAMETQEYGGGSSLGECSGGDEALVVTPAGAGRSGMANPNNLSWMNGDEGIHGLYASTQQYSEPPPCVMPTGPLQSWGDWRGGAHVSPGAGQEKWPQRAETPTDVGLSVERGSAAAQDASANWDGDGDDDYGAVEELAMAPRSITPPPWYAASSETSKGFSARLTIRTERKLSGR